MAKTGLFRTVKAFSFAAAIVAAGLFASASLASCSNLGGGYGDSSDSANSSVLIVGELPAGMGRVCGKIQNKNNKSSASKTVAPDSDTLETQINHYEICAWGTPDSGSPVPEDSPITGTVDSSKNFSIDLPFGTWILRADAVNADDQIILSKKSNPISLNEDSPVISQSFRLEYYKNSDETGKLNLPIGFATGRITTISYSLSAQAATPGFPISGTVAAPAGGTFNLNSTADTAFGALPPGTYDLVVEFLDANGIVVRLDQSVQIYSNLTTGKIDGSAPYVTSTGGVNVSSEVIEKYESSSYYVGGTGASDTNAGTQYDPFLTIQKAMARIDASALDSTTEFTIYLLGNANLGNNIIIDSGKKISIVGTNASAKYTVNGADSFSVTMGGSSLKCKNVIFNKVKDFAISAGQSEFANCSITNGKSSGNGGGLNVTGAGTKAVLKNCVVAGCRANDDTNGFGGGIYVEGPSSGAVAQVELTDCVVGASSSSCADGTSTAYSNFAYGGGGGLAIGYNGKAVLTNTKVLYNATKDGNGAGGGIRCISGGVLEITGGQINHNYAGLGGGGIYIYGSTTQVTIDGCAIGELSADAAPTGITNCGNYSAREGGGGILISSGVLSTTSGFSVIKNYSTAPTSGGSASGGGIAAIASSANTASLTLVNTKISYNASTSAGGGLYAKEYTKPCSVTGGEFIGNTAENGGGLCLYTQSGDNATLDGVLIQDNVATGNGGGIQVTNGKYLTIKGSTLISGNSAKNGGGLSAPGKVTFEGGTISGNTATTYGAGVYINSSTQVFTMKGNAYIADDNDVWLAKANQNKITVGGALTSTILPVATITPEEYEAGTPVLAASGLTEELCGKFALTQPAGVEFPWTIEYDSTNGGVLKHERNVIYVAAYPRGNDDSGDGTIDHPFATIKVASTKFTDLTPTGVVGYNAEFKNKIYVLTNMTYTAGLGSNNECYYEIVGCKDGTLNDNVTFTFDTPSDSGLYVAYGQKIKLTHIDITQSSDAANNYAAILVANDPSGNGVGELWMEDCSIKNMKANGCSAIAAEGNVHLKNVEITDNKAIPNTTGGVSRLVASAVHSTKGAVSVLGKVLINNNKMQVAADGSTPAHEVEMNVWIGEKIDDTTTNFNPIVVDGLITDSKIGVTLFDNTQVFTSYFGSKAGSGAVPSDYFTSDEGWTVVASGTGMSTQAKLVPPTTLYVRLGGSDLVGNGSSLLPFATIQKALDKINGLNNASADYTIKVEGVLAAAQHAAADDTLKAASLTIKGDSAATSVVSGGLSESSEPILWLSGVTVPVTIENIGFTNGKNSDSTSGGGAILAESCDKITIKDSGFTSCSATNTGGAIYLDGGTLTLSNTSFTGNSSGYNGGAIFVKTGTLEMNSGTIAANTATGSGGGVLVGSGGTFIMSGGKISGNSAGLNGGGISNSGIVCIYGDAVIGDDGASGTATSETDSSNKAVYNGGGICNSGKLALGYKTWTSSATAPSDPQTLDGGVYYNYAQVGGGIFNANSSALYIASGNISKNMAASTSNNDGGGGINSYGASTKLYMTGGTVSQNKSAHFGGGVLVYSGAAELTDVTISGNTASSNGGGFACVGGTVTMNSGTIGGLGAGNIGVGGAGVYLKQDAAAGTPVFTMKGGEVSYNTVASGGSGGGFMNQYGTLNIQGTAEISNNEGGSNGGGILTFGTTNMTGGTISANTAHNGGGVFVFQNDFAMSDGTISGNTATVNPSAADPSETGHGGGVYVNNLADGATTYLGDFKLSGEAYIPLGTGNDVYLQNSITIEGDLTHAAPAATITPSVYSSGTIVLTEASAGLVAGNYGKFAVADDSSGGEWTVNNLGYLAEVVTGGGTIVIHTPEGDLNLAASATTIATSESATTVTISATDASGDPITTGLTWNGVTVYYGTDEIDSKADTNSYKFKKTFPKGTYRLNVSVTYKGTTYSDSFTITKTVDGAVAAAMPDDFKKITAGTMKRATSILGPIYIATISKDYYMCDHEVTQKEWKDVMGNTQANLTSLAGGTSIGIGDNYPVYYVNWYHAIAYCNKRSIADGLDCVYEVEGVDFETLVFAEIPTDSDPTWDAVTCDWSADGYRLPTETEWQYAAIGTYKDSPNWNGVYNTAKGWDELVFAGYNGSNWANRGDYAWYGNNSSNKTHPVKQKLPNSNDMCDMTGNVCEWCWDWFNDDQYATDGNITDPKGPATGEKRAMRGSQLYSEVSGVGSRSSLEPRECDDCWGFRVVRNAP